MGSRGAAPCPLVSREVSRDTYLLRDGRICASDRPHCFERMGPLEARDAVGGLWAVVADAAGDATDAEPRRWHVVAWLSPAPGPAGAAPRRWHDFREAVLARYPGAGFRVYPREGAADAATPSVAHSSALSGP
jgi:hypothetical protein